MEDRLKIMKESLMACAQEQMNHLDYVDAEELGEVIDMIKDLEEAEYYCTITKAMKEKEEEMAEYGYRYYNKMPTPYYNDRRNDKVYRDSYYDNQSEEPLQNNERMTMTRDRREGKSPMSRKNYMESKEMHQPKTTQMRELEKYLQELSSDIVEMIQDASPEEKAFMEQKISALAAKINV